MANGRDANSVFRGRGGYRKESCAAPFSCEEEMRSLEGTEKGQSLKKENQDGAREGALRWGYISKSAD